MRLRLPPRSLAARAVLGSALAWSICTGDASAAEASLGDEVHSLPAEVRIGAERIGLPQGESLGLVGTTYLLDVGRGVWLGPAAYGAITGRRGGLFTIGAEASFRHALAGPLQVEAGVYAGGGGGGAAPVGSGLMLRPHVDLLWDFGGQRAGVSVSQVRFPSGQIDSRQIGLVWSAATDFRYMGADRSATPFDAAGRSGVGLDRIAAVAGTYRPRRSARRVSGGTFDASIAYLGVRADRAVGPHLYLGLEANGAASGGVAGYAEYLGVLGTETTLAGDRLAVGARGALGMGGGGDIATGGGLLAKAAVYGTLRLTRQLGLTVEGGYAEAPQGSFKAVNASAAVTWLLDDPGSPSAAVQVDRSAWSLGGTRYRAPRRNGPVQSLDAVTLQVDRYVGDHLYLTGQAQSATGGGAGGYSVGLFGLGWQTPMTPGWSAGAEVFAGAAGGGNVDTQGGAVVMPKLYLAWDATPAFGVRAGAGQVKALHGSMSSASVDVAMVFRFGVYSHGDR